MDPASGGSPLCFGVGCLFGGQRTPQKRRQAGIRPCADSDCGQVFAPPSPQARHHATLSPIAGKHVELAVVVTKPGSGSPS